MDLPMTKSVRDRIKNSVCDKSQWQAQAVILREHYASEASDSGLRSSHGPIVDMAASGIQMSGRASYEGAISDRRHGRHASTASKHRRIRHALEAVQDREGIAAETLRTVLYAAYRPDPRPWHPQVASALGEHLGDEIGVAIVTGRVQRGLDDGETGDLGAGRAKGSGDRPAAIRVWLPPAPVLGDSSVLDEIVSQSLTLLLLAHEALAAAMSGVSDARAPQRYVPPFYADGA